ncbi:tol-pal system-associated acyl-CoA thioesterase [Tahibacter amnicola]|uniref:Tol-pal system-associated acyl-CoA thioesterase n=1 Tax=Tahibacter amnicola TaxID=2976241 RepID=A0ABY6BCA6_9GAMM|nr:tol-pal system-associated acyl-CoA thioesterase [Tahibacter amnicola]UXI67671.1 tol-pal system-associated acyl-CoA thioesterase [Tahibacter amnicola]
MSVTEFSWPIRVYWEDTDAGGVTYHASYLRFLERARSEFLRARGIEQERLRADNSVVFVVRDLTIGFLKPARLDDVLRVTVALTERRGASLVFQQQILREADASLLVQARVRAACLDAIRFRPRPIPDDLFVETP